MYVDRKYREIYSAGDLASFRVVIKDTDLLILVDKESYDTDLERKAQKKTIFYRTLLEEYISRDPLFKNTLEPHLALAGAPDIALAMIKAGNTCGIGPMAAVAGAIAEWVGTYLRRYVKEVIVENGGDLFIQSSKPRTIGIFAGQSPFSDKLAVRIQPEGAPLGICTSSGTVGPSLSFGKADAVTILSPSTALADAAATATGNMVHNKEKVAGAVEFAKSIPGVQGALVIKDDQLAAWGEIEIVSR